MAKFRWRVDIVEHERGWGSKIEDRLFFDDEQEAKDYVKDYNDKYNTADVVPNWYMVAETPVKVQVG